MKPKNDDIVFKNKKEYEKYQKNTKKYEKKT